MAGAAILSSALLWGSGYELAPGDQLGYRVGDLRSAFSWAAAVITVVLLGYSILGLVTALLRGDLRLEHRRRFWRLSHPELLQKRWADRVSILRPQIDQLLLDVTVEHLRLQLEDREDLIEAHLRRVLERFFDEPWDELALRLPLPEAYNGPPGRSTEASSRTLSPRELPMTIQDIRPIEELVEELVGVAVARRQQTILERADSELYRYVRLSDGFAWEYDALGVAPEDVLRALQATLNDVQRWSIAQPDARQHGGVRPPSQFKGLDIARVVGIVTAAYVLTADAPTRLGRVIDAMSTSVQVRYGLDLGLAWPRLVPLLPDDERTQLEQAERATDASQLRAAGWVLAVVLIAAVGVYMWTDVSNDAIALPLLLTAIAVAGGILGRAEYSAAVRRTVHYGHKVEASVDLHRLKLLDNLGWRRPSDGEDEVYVFRALSRFLAGEATSEDLLRPSDTATATSVAELSSTVDALNALPQRLERHIGAGMDRVVDDGIARLEQSSETVVERSVEAVDSAVGRTLERHLQGPPRVNYDGQVGVILESPTGHVELDSDHMAGFDIDRLAALSPGHYTLRVAIGPASLVRSLVPHVEAVLQVRGGEKRAVVPFSVGVDSNISSARRDAVPVDAAQQALQVTDFNVDVPEDAPTASWLWVRVAQHGRTIQNLRLRLAVRGRP